MSKLLRLVKSDFVKGGLVFVGASVIEILRQMAFSNEFDWKLLLNVAVVAGLSYLLKNLSTERDADGGEFLGGKIKL
jgi:hypothetical protein